MAEKVDLPPADFFPEVGVSIKPDSWGEWRFAPSGKAVRDAFMDDGRAVVVYQSGAVTEPAGGMNGLIASPISKRIQSSEDARALQQRRYEKTIKNFQAGIVKGAKKINADVRGLGDAVQMMGEAAMRTAAAGGRDGITAQKWISQAADLRPAASPGKAGQDAGGLHLHLHGEGVAALLSALRLPAGADLVEEEARDLPGEAGEAGDS